jgi:hypothetical protein
MSHNIISVDGATPNVKSEVTSGIQFIQFGQGETPTSPSLTIQKDATFPFYDTSPINTIEGASISTTNDILDSITIPAGKYLVYINIGGTGITTGFNFAQYSMYATTTAPPTGATSTSTGSICTVGPLKYITFSQLYKPSWFHTTTSRTVYILCGNFNSTGTSVSGTNSRYAKNSSLCILKVD